MTVMKELTLLMLKPDGVRLAAIIEAELRTLGLEPIISLRVRWTEPGLRAFYAAHVGAPYWPTHLEHMLSGDCLAMWVAGEDAVAAVRALLGPTDPVIARRDAPDTLRALYGAQLPKNHAHASDSPEAATRELRQVIEEVVATSTRTTLAPRP